MNKSVGYKGISLIECINPKIKKYRVRWDFKPYTNEEGIEDMVTFMEDNFLHKPTIDEIKEKILSWANSEIDKKIISNFVWKDMSVWLSTENQFNYKAAYDIAVQTNGANLPVVFKFGDTYNPTYYMFNTIEDLTDFYMKAMEFVNKTLAEGWYYKDNIDWSNYEEELLKLK